MTDKPAEQKNPLAQDFNALSLLKFVLPTIVMMIFMGLYTLVDTIFVARFVNTNALSAINIVCPIINITVGLATMLATGGSAIIARKLGEKKDSEARENLALIVCAGIFTGILITAVCFSFLEPIIRGLGANDILFPYCRGYLKILLFFTTANILQCLYLNLFVTAGKPNLGLWLLILAGLANIVLDYIFIVVWQMGIGGAAWATGIGYMIPVLAGTYFFLRNRGSLFFAWPKPDWKMLGESCFNGSSEMASQLSTAITTFLFNLAMMKFLGEAGVAAITIIIYSQFLLTTLYIGFSMGTAPIISYAYGSNDTWQLKKIFRICAGFITFCSALIFVVSFFGGHYISALFAGQQANVLKIATQGFAIFSFSFLFCGINIFASAMFTAFSNGKISAIISFLRTLVFISAALLIFPIFWGVFGIWLAVPLAEFLTLIISVLFICRYRKQYGYLEI